MTQTIDFRFELLFLFCVLLTLVGLSAILVMWLRARHSAARKLLIVFGTGWGVYLVVVFVVAITTPQRIIPMRRDLCFDDMCFAVVDVQTTSRLETSTQVAPAHGVFYVVTVRVSSRARGRAQSERGLHALLWSPRGNYKSSQAGQSAWDEAHPENASLTTRLQPGQAILSTQVFDLPANAADVGLVLNNGFTPGYFVIGESPLFHKPTIIKLAP